VVEDADRVPRPDRIRQQSMASTSMRLPELVVSLACVPPAGPVSLRMNGSVCMVVCRR
jgi:hypothetical protein